MTVAWEDIKPLQRITGKNANGHLITGIVTSKKRTVTKTENTLMDGSVVPEESIVEEVRVHVEKQISDSGQEMVLHDEHTILTINQDMSTLPLGSSIVQAGGNGDITIQANNVTVQSQ